MLAQCRPSGKDMSLATVLGRLLGENVKDFAGPVQALGARDHGPPSLPVLHFSSFQFSLHFFHFQNVSCFNQWANSLLLIPSQRQFMRRHAATVGACAPEWQ